MAIIPPWTPPVGDTWNPVELYTRIGQGAALTFGEGDQNKTSAEDAINWIGNKLFEIMAQIGSSHITGDIRVSFYPTATEGWILLDGRTIGSATSGSTLTGVTYQPLYNVLWEYATNSDLLTSSGSPTTKGASAAADWADNKRFVLPDARGRVIVGAGTGTGLTNRVIMSRFGAEGGTFQHNHTISITSASALGTYLPSGSVSVDEVTLRSTPQGAVTVDTYNGNIVPTGSVEVDEAELSFVPIGTVSVSLSSITLSGAGSASISGVTCKNVVLGMPGEESVIDCDSILSVDINSIAGGLTASISVDSATFSGDPANLNHTHTASFTGSETAIDHTHLATFAGTEENLDHSHTASFTGDSVNLAHTHNVSGNSSSVTYNYSVMQPSLAAYTYIKL